MGFGKASLFGACRDSNVSSVENQNHDFFHAEGRGLKLHFLFNVELFHKQLNPWTKERIEL